MADYSETEQYDMLEDMLHGTKKFLCQVFKRRWREETGKDWRKLSRSEKISMLGKKTFENAKCIESIARSTGNLRDCELVLLSSGILSFCQVEKYAKENDAVTAIKTLRESLAAKYSGKMSSRDYGIEMDKICSSLECLGIKKKEIGDQVAHVKRGRLGRPKKACNNECMDLFELKNEFLINLLKSEVNHIKADANGEDLFLKGIRYLLVAKKGQSENWVQAASYFRQAVKKNHVEALAFLASFYQNDKQGVGKDFDEAKILFERAAEIDVKSPGAFTLYKCNIGVARAQESLGSMYLNGQIKINSEKTAGCSQDAGQTETMDAGGDTNRDPKQAAVWFEKAMENGDGLAAYKLAVLYLNGLGVEKNDSMAEMCFKESMKLGYALAFVPLAKHYLMSLETEKAMYIRKLGMATWSGFISQEEDEKLFYEVATSKGNIRKRWERQVKNFESEYGLEIKGLSFAQRFVRPICYSNIFADNFDDILDESMLSAYTFHCFGTANFIEGDPMLEIHPYQKLFQLVEEKQELAESDKFQVLEWVYQILIQGLRFVPMRELTAKGVGKILESLRQEEKYKEEGELDKKLRLCCSPFNLFSNCDKRKSIQMLVEGTQRYPDNCTYRAILCIYLGHMGNWTWGLRTAEEGLKVDPKNVELMYLEAVFFSFLYSDEHFEKSVAKYEEFLRNVLDNDPIVPDAWYAVSALCLQKLEDEMEPSALFLHVGTDIIDRMSSYFSRGFKAEDSQLPCFLPYRTSSLKLKVGVTVLSCVRDTERGSVVLKNISKVKEEDPVLERKIYLGSPTRKGLITLHRQNIKDKSEDDMDNSTEEWDENVDIEDLPKLEQTLTEGLSSLKAITLLEMNPIVEHIFKYRLLELTILVGPDLTLDFLASVGEDNDGDVIRVHVYNFEDEDNITEKFSVGSRIAVINPYLSMAKADLYSCIRIDDLRSVIYQRKLRNMCGFCGEEDSTYHCSDCQCIYCSVECKDLDVERHGHSLICS